jgi:type VI secretion system protein ImpM
MPNPTGGNSAPVGFFGKLPGAGDFVQRRLPAEFVDRWDAHFQYAVAASREKLGEQWQETWHASPSWRFVLSPGVCGESAWAGVMAPAADRVGRCFPMVMAASLGADAAACSRTLRESQRWFDALEYIHAEARKNSLGADAFDTRLCNIPGPLQVTRGDPVATLQGTDWRTSPLWRMPLRGHSHDETFLEALWSQATTTGARWCLWWSGGARAVPASAMLTEGLPAPASYVAFLDAARADESWRTLRAFGGSTSTLAAPRPPAAAPAVSPEPVADRPVASASPRQVLLPDDLSGFLDGIGEPAAAPIDDLTVPGFARARAERVASSPAPPAPAQIAHAEPARVEAPATSTGSSAGAVYRSPDGALTVLAADDGAHDPRCCGAATAQAVAAAMQQGDFSGGMQKLRERLLARHDALHATGEDLIDPVMEDAAVVALHTTGRWAAVLRIGTGEVWQWRRGQMRPVFVEEVGPQAGVDTLLRATRASVATGLGGSGEAEYDEMVCAVEPGDRFLLLATRRLVGLDQNLLAQALAMPDREAARALVAHASALGVDPSPWPVAVIEIES